jgi:glycosidase
MNLLGTHDTERILTVLGGESSDGYTNKELSVKKMTLSERKRAIELLKMAYAINATLPGIPCIYYGDEAGMEGYRDPFNRMPYPWGKEEMELVDFYKSIGKLRTNENVYKKGFFKVIYCERDILAFSRYDNDVNIITMVNRSSKTYKILSNAKLKDLESGSFLHQLPPFKAFIVKSNKSFYKTEINFCCKII